MRERIAIAVIALLVAGALSACTSEDLTGAEPASPTAATTDQPTLSETTVSASTGPPSPSTETTAAPDPTTEDATTTTTPGPLAAAPPEPEPPPLRSEEIGFATGSVILDLDADDRGRDLDRMVELGASWVRFDFDWSRIESRRSDPDWSTVDELVIDARQRGLHVLGLIAYTPTWARPDGTSDKAPPDDPDEFARFVGDVLDRYGNHVRAWEIWNEPNVSSFWETGPDPEAYAELLVAASAVTREADPDAIIVTGGLAPALDRPGDEISPAEFLAGIYDSAPLDSFDAVGIHPYTYPGFPSESQEWNTFAALDDLRGLMVDRGDADRPLWLTEFGAPTGTGDRAVSESDQARMIDEAMAGVRDVDWAGPLFVYSLRDIEGGPADDIEANFGVLFADGSPKAAAAVVRERS